MVKKKAKIDKGVAKKLTGGDGVKGEGKQYKKTRYARRDKVDEYVKSGWKVIDENKDVKKRTLDVKNDTPSDLVLIGK